MKGFVEFLKVAFRSTVPKFFDRVPSRPKIREMFLGDCTKFLRKLKAAVVPVESWGVDVGFLVQSLVESSENLTAKIQNLP